MSTGGLGDSLGLAKWWLDYDYDCNAWLWISETTSKRIQKALQVFSHLLVLFTSFHMSSNLCNLSSKVRFFFSWSKTCRKSHRALETFEGKKGKHAKHAAIQELKSKLDKNCNTWPILAILGQVLPSASWVRALRMSRAQTGWGLPGSLLWSCCGRKINLKKDLKSVLLSCTC